MGAIVPFPLARRGQLIHRCAARMRELPPATAEKHLRETLRVQTDTMARRGILATTIDIEIRALECAVRAALWRQVLTPGGAA